MYILYCILTEIVGYSLHLKHLSTEFLYEIFTIIEFCFFCAYFYFVVHHRIIRKYLSLLSGIFILAGVVDHYYILKESYTSGLQAVLILAMCIFYFFEQLKSPNSFLIYNSISFWIINSFLLYVAGTFFLYIMAENMVADKIFRKQYIIINDSFNLVKNILLSIAMLMKEDRKNNNYFPVSDLHEGWGSLRSIKT